MDLFVRPPSNIPLSRPLKFYTSRIDSPLFPYYSIVIRVYFFSLSSQTQTTMKRPELLPPSSWNIPPSLSSPYLRLYIGPSLAFLILFVRAQRKRINWLDSDSFLRYSEAKTAERVACTRDRSLCSRRGNFAGTLVERKRHEWRVITRIRIADNWDWRVPGHGVTDRVKVKRARARKRSWH